MRNVGKVLRNTTVDESKFEVELLNFLRDYRSTPQTATKYSPHSLLFKSNSTTSRLPIVRDGMNSTTSDAIRNDDKSKAKIKRYADKKLRTRESTLQVGDLVYLKYDTRKSKSQPDSLQNCVDERHSSCDIEKQLNSSSKFITSKES